MGETAASLMSSTNVIPCRISLIYPPYGPVHNEPGLKAVKENYGLFPSLSLSYVAGIVEHAGHEVQFVDANALNLSLEETINQVRSFQPEYMTFTLTTYLFFESLSWIEALKRAINVPVIVGGVHLKVYSKETLMHQAIDYGIVGEAEETFPELLVALRSDHDLHQVKGLVFREHGEVVQTEHRPDVTDVNQTPFPARHLLPNERYNTIISQYKNFTPLITSRGCPFRCSFCEQGRLRFRPRSAENVVDEIQQCVEEYGVVEFDFFDSTFTIQKQRVIEICQEIVRRELHTKIKWAARSRVDTINEEMLRWMKRAGCVRIYYGIESGDPGVLKQLRKDTDLEKCRATIRLTSQLGIRTFGYFMVGSPGETSETVRRTIDLAKTLDLDYAQFSKVTAMPTTELYDQLVEKEGRDYWKEFILQGTGNGNGAQADTPQATDFQLPRFGTTMSEEDICRWARTAYLEFYFRPSYFVKALLRMRSWEELWRSATAAWAMLTDHSGRDDEMFFD